MDKIYIGVNSRPFAWRRAWCCRIERAGDTSAPFGRRVNCRTDRGARIQTRRTQAFLIDSRIRAGALRRVKCIIATSPCWRSPVSFYIVFHEELKCQRRQILDLVEVSLCSSQNLASRNRRRLEKKHKRNKRLSYLGFYSFIHLWKTNEICD